MLAAAVLALPSSAFAGAVATATTVTVTPSPVNEGASVKVTVTVAEVVGVIVPTGTVTLSCNGQSLATVPLSHGTATLTDSTAGLASGAYPVIASYSGDSVNAASVSPPDVVNIVGTTTTAVTFGATKYAIGQTAVVNATVTAPSGGGTPSGTVKFSVGTTALGSASLVSGVATLQASSAGLPAGAYNVTATYQGNSAFQPSAGTAAINLVPVIAPANAALIPTGTVQFSLSPVPTGTVTWYVNGVPGGDSYFGTIDATGNYTAPPYADFSSKIAITAAVSNAPDYFTPPAYIYLDSPGKVAATTNTQVAAYNINIPDGASVSVNFGTTTAYGLNTWSLPAPNGGGAVTILVAGMLASTQYHMQAVVSLPGGLTFTDADKTFTTGASASTIPVDMVTNGTPQPGLEFVNVFMAPGAFVFDLSGNLLWTYSTATALGNAGMQPFKPLPDGNFLITLSPESAYSVDGSVINPETPTDIREVDLTNTTIRDLDLSVLQANLNHFGYVNSLGDPIVLLDMHHDVTINPTTGHWLVIANTLQVADSVTGYTGPQEVLGDVILDVDPANGFAVDWVWSEFDHFDVNRHPMGVTDWTHTNAIIYSQDDGNILVSMRAQNWIVRVNYQNGAGNGDVMWRLGYQGDFTLVGGTDPIDWQYAQHGPSFTTTNTTGVFGLAVMDNGNDRTLGSSPCPVTTSPCVYSRTPVFSVDETAMTATLSNGQIGPGYSNFGGNAEVLANGDIESDYCAISTGAVIQETTQGATPQLVWQATTPGTSVYRGFRVPSLYPGITWSADALKFQADHAVRVK